MCESFGPVDVLIYNPSVPAPGHLFEVDLRAYGDENQNLRGERSSGDRTTGTCDATGLPDQARENRRQMSVPGTQSSDALASRPAKRTDRVGRLEVSSYV